MSGQEQCQPCQHVNWEGYTLLLLPVLWQPGLCSIPEWAQANKQQSYDDRTHQLEHIWGVYTGAPFKPVQVVSIDIFWSAIELSLYQPIKQTLVSAREHTRHGCPSECTAIGPQIDSYRRSVECCAVKIFKSCGNFCVEQFSPLAYSRNW